MTASVLAYLNLTPAGAALLARLPHRGGPASGVAADKLALDGFIARLRAPRAWAAPTPKGLEAARVLAAAGWRPERR